MFQKKIFCSYILLSSFLFFHISPLTASSVLNEYFSLYNAPEALSMGNAFDADSPGYLAPFYNPAGLSNYIAEKKKEIIPFDYTQVMSTGGFSSAWKAQSLGIYPLMGPMQTNSQYSFFQLAMIPSFRFESFEVALLISYRYAAQSSSSGIQIDAVEDVVPTLAKSFHFFHRLIHIGFTGQVIDRNALQGSYAFGTFSNGNSVLSKMSEGIGVSLTTGIMATVPVKFLPTMGVVWHNMFDTAFHSIHFLNGRALSNRVPNSLPQTFNAAFSIHPYLTKRFRGTFAFEMQHIEMGQLGVLGRMHLGAEVRNDYGFLIWAGLNEIYPTFGLGLRRPQGTFEVGTYAENIGTSSNMNGDRRFFLRYTLTL